MLATAGATAWLSTASADTFVVNDVLDEGDPDPGNGFCAATGGSCTLRAAIEETNAIGGMDVIELAAGTYYVDEQLLIEDSVWLVGEGAGSTYIDGQGVTSILRAKTVEALVCDASNDRVNSYDRNGQRNVNFLGSGAGGLDTPMALVELPGSSRDVLVAAFGGGVYRYDREGLSQGLLVAPDAGGGVYLPVEMLVGSPSVAEGDLLVADFLPSGGIRRFDPASGAFVELFVPGGSGGLAQPSGMAVHDGEAYLDVPEPRDIVFEGDYVYVSSGNDDMVMRWDADAPLLGTRFVAIGSGGLDRPSDISFGPDGDPSAFRWQSWSQKQA